MPQRIGLARHIGFTTNGTPIVAELPALFCLETGVLEDDLLGGRQIDFTTDGIPIVGVVPRCCYESYPCPRVEDDVIPGGVELRLHARAWEVQNCGSARNQVARLTYCGPTSGGTSGGEIDCSWSACGESPNETCPCDPTHGKWIGTLDLRSGSLYLELCFSGGGLDPVSARLSWSGCNEGCQDVEPECLNPLIINFIELPLNDCCGCPAEESTEAAAVNLTITGNCHPVTRARHIDFLADGTPVVGLENCPGYEPPPPRCAPLCGLVLSVEGAGDCSCLSDTVSFPFVGSTEVPVWENLAVGSCTAPAVVQMTCVLDEEVPGTVRLCMTVTCGATNTGSACINVLYEDLEELDETFEITMSDPSAGLDCADNDCTYTWNDMTQTWSLTTADCAVDCDDCPNGPDDPSPGSFDGQQRSQPCTGSYTVPCCIGTITARVTRAA